MYTMYNHGEANFPAMRVYIRYIHDNYIHVYKSLMFGRYNYNYNSSAWYVFGGYGQPFFVQITFTESYFWTVSFEQFYFEQFPVKLLSYYSLVFLASNENMQTGYTVYYCQRITAIWHNVLGGYVLWLLGLINKHLIVLTNEMLRKVAIKFTVDFSLNKLEHKLTLSCVRSNQWRWSEFMSEIIGKLFLNSATQSRQTLSRPRQ